MKVYADLDCCAHPVLAKVRTLREQSHDSEEVARCTSCGAGWLSAWHEYLTFGPDGDLSWTWYARLSESESASLVAADRPPSHEFLHGRPVFLVHHSDADRLQMLDGPPRWVR